ncbi:MAG TPA: phosphate ABC transporter substrate-binding protein [Gammaproteobacteria bacterium]|nr:phosphate ABC transporter substrate-binding protein [Gammaproteobacteria bacterium]
MAAHIKGFISEAARGAFFTLMGAVLALTATSAGAAANPTPSLSSKTLIWAGCGITKKAFMAELAKAYYKKAGIKIELHGGGATKGIRQAAKGEIDIGGACRATMDHNPLERNAFQIPVAWDALVVIVHKGNPVDNITFKQLRNIYLGKITNWKELGGRDEPIHLYARKGKISGVGRTLRELVFADYDQDFTSRATYVRSSGPLEKAVVSEPDAMGTTGVSSAHKRDVKILKLNGKEPSYENIKNGDYVLYRPLYLVTNRTNHDPRVKAFIDFALSPEGKAIIRRTGTVPYADALPLVMKQLDQYKRATAAGL